MQGLIKAFIVSIEEKIQISPLLVLEYSMDIKELELPKVSMNLPYNKVLTDDDIENLYNAFHRNQPRNYVGIQYELGGRIEEDGDEEDGDEEDVY